MTGGRQPGPSRIRVEAYSGYKAEERPVAFEIGAQRRVVEAVIDQWAGEDHAYFKLLADDHKVYLVRYDRTGDFWTLEKVTERIGIH